MKPGIQALREQRNTLSKEANNVLAQNGDKIWTVEDKAKFDGIADQIERLDSQMEATQLMLKNEAEEAFGDIDQFRRKTASAEGEEPARTLLNKALCQGFNALTREEHTQIRNTLSTGTGNQGGYSVQTSVGKELIDLLKGYRGVREVATNLTLENGAPFSYPTSDGTSEVGELIGENTTATGADPVFGTAPLPTYKFSSKIVAVPFELLQDSQIDMVAFIYRRLKDRIGRAQNQYFTTGTGTAQPHGITVAASVGKTGTTGQTLTVIYDDLVDLVESVDYAYAESASLQFMLSQSIRKVVRKIKDTAGRPIWTPSYDSGIGKGNPDQLLGYNVALNNDLAVPAANAKTIAFGAFDRYIVRDAMDITLFRFDDSAYAKLGQVGFLAWARAGGNLMDTNAVKLYQHSAT